MPKVSGHCGVCGKVLAIKVLVDRVSPDARQRPYCVDETDELHKQAEGSGWDPYDPETPSRSA
jgi:hypothetical protein